MEKSQLIAIERYEQVEIYTSLSFSKRWIAKSSLTWILGRESQAPFARVKDYCLVTAEDMVEELTFNFIKYHNSRARVAVAYAGKVAAKALSSEITGKNLDLDMVFTAKGLFEVVNNVKLVKQRYLKRRAENIVAKELRSKEDGCSQVAISTGRVDVLTQSEVIEIKCVTNWKHAIGQAMVYQLSYPERKPRIHLFGKSKIKQKDVILDTCRKLGIIVTFED